MGGNSETVRSYSQLITIGIEIGYSLSVHCGRVLRALYTGSLSEACGLGCKESRIYKL